MLYRGARRNVPSSRYGGIIPILERMHWTLQEYLEQPDDLITELSIRMDAEARESEKKRKIAETPTRRYRR